MKQKINILLADKINTDRLNRYFPRSKFKVDIAEGKKVLTNEEIISNYKDHDVLVIRSIRKINKDFIDRTNFKIIATCSRGSENIETEYAEKRGIVVLNTDKGNSVSTAEHTIGLMISFYKNFSLSDKLIRKNEFTNNDFQRNELCGKTLGIIGFGNVGSYVGKLASFFGMNILANDISEKVINRNKKKHQFVSLGKLLKSSDIITVHIPGIQKNENFINKKKISLLKKDSLFVNTSRGTVVNEDDLIEILRAEKIRGAALDVFKNEPFIDERFLKLKNVLLTNHIAGKTIESALKMSVEIYQKVLKSLEKMQQI